MGQKPPQALQKCSKEFRPEARPALFSAAHGRSRLLPVRRLGGIDANSSRAWVARRWLVVKLFCLGGERCPGRSGAWPACLATDVRGRGEQIATAAYPSIAAPSCSSKRRARKRHSGPTPVFRRHRRVLASPIGVVLRVSQLQRAGIIIPAPKMHAKKPRLSPFHVAMVAILSSGGRSWSDVTY
jgi:hypothetical protein